MPLLDLLPLCIQNTQQHEQYRCLRSFVVDLLPLQYPLRQMIFSKDLYAHSSAQGIGESTVECLLKQVIDHIMQEVIPWIVEEQVLDSTSNKANVV